MKSWVLLTILLVGIVLGVSGTYFLPGVIRPYIPGAIEGKDVTVEGKVVAKQRKNASLLLTIDTPQGALLATFKKKVNEIELLVSIGDFVEFSLRRYKPFVNDPVIKRVRKEGVQPPQRQMEDTSSPVKTEDQDLPPTAPAEDQQSPSENEKTSE